MLITTPEWFAAHLDDYHAALLGGTADYLAQQLADLRDLAAHLIGETV